MKKTILAGIMSTMFVSASYAGDIVEVPITNVKPNYVVTEVRVPVNNCNQQLVPTHRNGGGFTANNIIGGVIGGILGNQFGKLPRAICEICKPCCSFQLRMKANPPLVRFCKCSRTHVCFACELCKA